MQIFFMLRCMIVVVTVYSATAFGELGPVYGKKGVWYQARLTWYQSYPEEGSEECLKFNGCEYAGLFAFADTKKSEEWVRENNIIAVHSAHARWLRLEQLRLRINPEDTTKEIVGTVYDMCADSDCNGCCTRNVGDAGYLIDLEISTLKRLGFTKDSYPYYIYFMIYETDKDRIKREISELESSIRKKDKEIKKEEKRLGM